MISAARRLLPCGFLVCIAALFLSCFGERTRPDPIEPPAAQLSVEVIEPLPDATVIAGRDIVIRISARDLAGSNLAGVGFVVRRAAEVLDSAALRFMPTTEHTGEFPFRVPAELPSNVELDVFGIALGPSTQSRVSSPRSVVVVQCEPKQPGCD